MGWSYPDISLEDLVNLVKGFVDIMILTSGYQSSGLPAIWDPQNIKKALQWGLFFENVLTRLNSAEYADDYTDSVVELEAALLEMRSDPYFPQGIVHLSSSTLAKARDFILRHLIHTLPLGDAHLTALLTAIVEMDLEDLQRVEENYLCAYLEKLTLENVKGGDGEYAGGCHSQFAIQELLKRQNNVSCLLSVEKFLDILSKKASHIYSNDFKSKHGVSPVKEEMLTKFDVWSQWKSKNLSYLLDKRTVRLVSGARLIFSAPKVQWMQVLERLRVSAGFSDDELIETLELSMLGCIQDRWSHTVEHFTSVSYNVHPISKQYDELYSFLLGRSHHLQSMKEAINTKENDILEYLTMLLSDKVHQFWKLSPVLAASAIRSRSPLYRLYLGEIEKQFKGNSSSLRCCSCIQDGSDHSNCK
ncbi:hypothetical protein Scep_029344 [Stephania cephalantha]|uniref:Uncharacterized protein n=1 Tax=Stephania cephalantha TaxID=152367 RepID=A0AAP0HC51_9MAGN